MVEMLIEFIFAKTLLSFMIVIWIYLRLIELLAMTMLQISCSCWWLNTAALPPSRGCAVLYNVQIDLHSYMYPFFPTKALHNYGPVHISLYSSISLFHCKTTIYDMIHKCGSDLIRDSDSYISTSSSITSSSNTTTTYSYTSSNCSSTSMLLQFRVVEVLHSQKMVVIVMWVISIYMLSNDIG